LNEEREAVSSILSWALILAAVVLSGAFMVKPTYKSNGPIKKNEFNAC